MLSFSSTDLPRPLFIFLDNWEQMRQLTIPQWTGVYNHEFPSRNSFSVLKYVRNILVAILGLILWFPCGFPVVSLYLTRNPPKCPLPKISSLHFLTSFLSVLFSGTHYCLSSVLKFCTIFDLPIITYWSHIYIYIWLGSVKEKPTISCQP